MLAGYRTYHCIVKVLHIYKIQSFIRSTDKYSKGGGSNGRGAGGAKGGGGEQGGWQFVDTVTLCFKGGGGANSIQGGYAFAFCTLHIFSWHQIVQNISPSPL